MKAASTNVCWAAPGKHKQSAVLSGDAAVTRHTSQLQMPMEGEAPPCISSPARLDLVT